MLTKDNIEQMFKEDYLKFAKKQIEKEISDPTAFLLMDIKQFKDICLSWCSHGYEFGTIRGEQCSKENIDKSIKKIKELTIEVVCKNG